MRIIGATSLTDKFTWIGAAYNVHIDMRSHTGGDMSMGIGAVHSKVSVQHFNTKSSTEAEIVGVSEYLPCNSWIMNFMSAQGYKIKNNFFIKMIRVKYAWRRTEELSARITQDISIYDIFS